MDRWYTLAQIAIAAIAAGALVVLVLNFIITGRDVPTGLASLLGGIFGAVFAVDALIRRKLFDQRGIERRREDDDDD